MTTKIEYPYPPDDGSTHWPGCWKEPHHHNCAVSVIHRLKKALEEIRDCPMNAYPPKLPASATQYDRHFATGVDAGHRCAAEVARDAIADIEPPE